MESTVLPTVLFVAFTVLASVGAYLIGHHFRSRAVGAVTALLVLAFMVALYFYVTWLLGILSPPEP